MTVRAPSGLGSRARAMWRKITKEYELRADELIVLEEACRELDLVVSLTEEIDAVDEDGGKSLTVSGSMGQPVAHPLLAELRHHRALMVRTLQQLHLPENPDAAARAAGERSSRAREAAQARWGTGG